MPADCFAARGERAAWCRRGVAEGSYALACFIFRFLRRPRFSRPGERCTSHKTFCRRRQKLLRLPPDNCPVTW
ncbi:hypothetical protein GK17_25495 [Salmonella enterica subsp. enterica serovar Heidelberg]|nr:hypothetical protein [Salmonella enterica subsp. enterica serovar Heidelberg]EED3785454.1 hypothetical protein [Salmonella enterica subsp. enterica serovar Heidelberg]EED3785476.1 hypothetical protein [Salmonella enterica subsp. enterica serovar Heidelberg]